VLRAHVAVGDVAGAEVGAVAPWLVKQMLMGPKLAVEFLCTIHLPQHGVLHTKSPAQPAAERPEGGVRSTGDCRTTCSSSPCR